HCARSSLDLPIPTHSAHHCLLLSYTGDPTPLHSFPTRRSSDLTVPPAQADSQRLEAVRLRSRSDEARSANAPRAARRPLVRRGRDRKSTRLNSSHVKISYAVFCLKKKKKIHPTYTAPGQPAALS